MTNIVEVENKMITLREQQVILDSDVAELYGVETKRVNEAVSNNPEKFPEGYVWELTEEEVPALRSKISTLKKTGRGQHSKYPPKAFTEKGLYMVFRRGFRLADAHTGELEVPPRLTASAEWCAPSYETRREKMGDGKGAPLPQAPSPPPIFSLCPPCAGHHSASDDRNWRNLLRSKRYFHKTGNARRPTACLLTVNSE